MTLEIAVTTLAVLGYALGAYADERRARHSRLGRRPLGGARLARRALSSAP